MKKIIYLAIIAFTFVMVGCSNECTCTTSYSGTGSESRSTTTEDIEKMDSGSKCSDIDSENTDSTGLVTKISCK